MRWTSRGLEPIVSEIGLMDAVDFITNWQMQKFRQFLGPAPEMSRILGSEDR
jgi:hypothetical protein